MDEASSIDNTTENYFELPSSLKKKIQCLDEVESFFQTEESLRRKNDYDFYYKKNNTISDKNIACQHKNSTNSINSNIDQIARQQNIDYFTSNQDNSINNIESIYGIFIKKNKMSEENNIVNTSDLTKTKNNTISYNDLINPTNIDPNKIINPNNANMNQIVWQDISSEKVN